MRIPSINKRASPTIDKTPKIQWKLLFRITRNTTANKIRVAPSFQIRIKKEEYRNSSF